MVGSSDPIPGEAVFKCGRTTGAIAGYVGGAVVEKWVDGSTSLELTTTGRPGLPFGASGDSGSIVGLLHGVNLHHDFCTFTPIKDVLDDKTHVGHDIWVA